VKRCFCAEVCDLQSINGGLIGHKFSGIPNFPPSPELHCILFRALLLLLSPSNVYRLWWAHQPFLYCVQCGPFEGDRDGADLWCLCSRLSDVSPTVWHCWHPCMRTSPYTRWSLRWISASGFSSLTRNSITARCRSDALLSAIFSRVRMLTWRNNWRYFSLKGASTDGVTCHTIYVPLLLRGYSQCNVAH
jgi:hypothetical protein